MDIKEVKKIFGKPFDDYKQNPDFESIIYIYDDFFQKNRDRSKEFPFSIHLIFSKGKLVKWYESYGKNI